MTPILFDPAKDSLDQLAALHRSSFDHPWNAAAIADLLAGPGVFVFHAPDGFILARAAAGEAEILTLAVTPAARGRGLGRALLQAATDHVAALGAQSIFLEVGTDNPAALALYAGMGFVPVGRRKGYYVSSADGAEDALVLRRTLSPGKNFA
jgi:[ribosomal protein S18]-alanine N-acetyltransferase